MNYLEHIESIISRINPELVDFSKARERGSTPTQATSEFLTNKEQGDWAEKTLLKAINEYSHRYIAVKYGRDDDIIAGEENFQEFYEEYQNELDEIGKRPDILIFDRNDFDCDTLNISTFSREYLDQLVPKAKCGIEVRSSSFLTCNYELYMAQKRDRLLSEAVELKNLILTDYGELLKTKNIELYRIIESLSDENIHEIKFRAPSWRKSEQLFNLSSAIKQLKKIISEICDKRTFMSIIPKVEDLKIVYNWIKKYEVPHYYVQVFFDKAYGISFEKILDLIGKTELKGVDYFIESSDAKNQNKTTIKINANKQANILDNISLPEHCSAFKELGRGRLLFYVKFKESASSLNEQGFERLFGFGL